MAVNSTSGSFVLAFRERRAPDALVESKQNPKNNLSTRIISPWSIDTSGFEDVPGSRKRRRVDEPAASIKAGTSADGFWTKQSIEKLPNGVTLVHTIDTIPAAKDLGDIAQFHRAEYLEAVERSVKGQQEYKRTPTELYLQQQKMLENCPSQTVIETPGVKETNNSGTRPFNLMDSRYHN